MKISHFGIKLSVAILIGLVLISYGVYWKAVSTLSDHMTSLIEASNHLANGEAFHSSIHSMMMDTNNQNDRLRYEEDYQKAEKGLHQLQEYLDHIQDGTAKRMLYENTARMSKEYTVFKSYTEKIMSRENTGNDKTDIQQVQRLFNGIFKEYKKLHQHHSQQRKNLLSRTQSIRKSIRVMLFIQIITACIVGFLVILYLDRMVLKVFDITEKLALHDKLTGLYNRHGLERIVADLEKPRDKNRKGYGIILIDIDHFKQFNDNYGHSAGDQVLVGLANVLLETVRIQDRVVRFGGEEILILLSQADISGTRKVAHNICRIVAETPFDLLDGKEPKKVTVSIGYAAASYDQASFHDLLKLADKRLYAAKERGRNISVGP